MTDNAVIGVDFGTDSVRSVIVDADNGQVLAEASAPYPRWARGEFCRPEANQFRQHPLDYLECLETTLTQAVAQAGPDIAAKVKGLAVDTTGSTPVAVDTTGTPLALTPGFETDPDAMFILWKDHTAVAEAQEITATAKSWGGADVTCYSGGTYSSEWFWAKMLHVLRTNEKVRGAAASWMEHCDWMTGVLMGNTDPTALKRSRCAAGHKAMWHPDFGGLPGADFLKAVDPLLADCADLYTDTFPATTPAGTLSPEWTKKLGLPQGITVAVGIIDAHAGAIGGEIQPGALLKVMGTSTCDMITAPPEAVDDRLIQGICGQVNGSILPDMVGMEAGQSAFGDLYAWFRDLLLWPITQLSDEELSPEKKQALADGMIPALSKAAAEIAPSETAPVALDWMNGRRTPDANQNLKGTISGLTLGTSAPAIFRALVEATAFGSRRIAERFREEGVAIDSVIAVGGVAKKSPLVMQIVADVMDMEIRVARSEQTCAQGAAMLAATAAGLYPDLGAAQKALGHGFETTYTPIPEHVAVYNGLYHQYLAMGAFVEATTE